MLSEYDFNDVIMTVKFSGFDDDVVVDVFNEFLKVSDGHGRGVVGGVYLTD